MIRNYLLLALRNMRKNKLHTFINIGGMTVAFTCSIFILLLAYRHFTFDDFQKNRKNIYKVYSRVIGPGGEEVSEAMAFPLTNAMKTESIGVTKATSIVTRGKLVRTGERTLDMSTTMVEPDFLQMFTFPVVKGNAASPLGSVSNAVITEFTAKKLYGNDDPVGKPVEVKLGGKWYALTVSAVVKDFPENSTIRFSILARKELDPDYARISDTWDNQTHPLYVQLDEKTTKEQAESRLRFLTRKYMPADKERDKERGLVADKNGDFYSLHLLPLEKEHFSPHLSNSGSTPLTFLYVIILIACVILLIASFNFVNLNIGLSFTRTKEIGIRKCLGAGKKQIWLQVWGESFIMVLTAMLLGIGLVALLVKNFNHLLDNAMNTGYLLQPWVLLILFVLLLLVSFIASGYPSSILARLKTVEILKGKITIKRPGALRNGLIVTQFVIAIALMCCTFIIFQQFDYLRSAPLGYNTSSLISIPIKNEEKGKEIISQLRTRLATEGSVVAVTGSDVNLGIGADHSSSTSIVCFEYKGQPVCGQTLSVGQDFLKTLDIKPVSGHDFSSDYSEDAGPVVIASQSFADQFGKNIEAGFSYRDDDDTASKMTTIAAIIPDIRIKSFNAQQKPVVFYLNKGNSMNYAWLKVVTGNPVTTMNLIKNTYASIEPGVDFNGTYVNENIERMYRSESIMAKMFSIAAIIAIVLSCMGLFGIASIVIRQRVKEIGIRKVLGASVPGIVTLVTREFIRPVIIALAIAVPVAWWLMHEWLQEYTLRVSIKWWVFVMAGIAAVIVTAVTISFQSLKAAFANPVKSLRSE